MKRQYTSGTYYKAIYFMKMGYTHNEISEILNIPIEIIQRWEKGDAPVEAVKIPLSVIKKRISKYKYPELTSKNLPLYSALLGIFTGAGTITISYTYRERKGYGEFEHIIALITDKFDFIQITSNILAKIIGTDIAISEKSGKWGIRFRNRDLACFLIENLTLTGHRLKKIVEYNKITILSWLFFFKLSRSRYGQYITHVNKDILQYFKQLENRVGVKTIAEPIWHKETYQLYVPKRFYKIIGDTRKDLTDKKNWPYWLKNII